MNLCKCLQPAEGVNVFELYPSRSMQTFHGFYDALGFIPVPTELCVPCAAKETLEDGIGAEAMKKIMLAVQDKTTLFPDVTQTKRLFISYDMSQFTDMMSFINSAKKIGADQP